MRRAAFVLASLATAVAIATAASSSAAGPSSEQLQAAALTAADLGQGFEPAPDMVPPAVTPYVAAFKRSGVRGQFTSEFVVVIMADATVDPNARASIEAIADRMLPVVGPKVPQPAPAIGTNPQRYTREGPIREPQTNLPGLPSNVIAITIMPYELDDVIMWRHQDVEVLLTYRVEPRVVIVPGEPISLPNIGPVDAGPYAMQQQSKLAAAFAPAPSSTSTPTATPSPTPAATPSPPPTASPEPSPPDERGHSRRPAVPALAHDQQE